MSKKRRKLEIKVDPLPIAYLERRAPCPVCGKDGEAMGRRALQIVFRCERCKVVYKRAHGSPLGY
jgi:tRNA(Ile2) C34 agmatinyltransferase TiaS